MFVSSVDDTIDHSVCLLTEALSLGGDVDVEAFLVLAFKSELVLHLSF